ncbi:SRPBCC family protein [Vibrio sp. ZSDE26]|uniref:SRPBCC family protein n=1 Tax=Vibrio amylolyticus TaxID=2847292 RepID=A0A9X1XF04_9VIBR|nr:SRPBCC family protein [Vibrio amylolyticus]MCK6261777.1 SRPBCC family protein [Vibrio amylolyticus]
MAHYTDKSIKVNIPAEQVWKVLADFSSIEKFAVTIDSSPIISEVKSGVGARRLCTFQDGSSLVEEITEYHDGQSYKMELSEYSLPLKSMLAEMGVKAIDENTSEIYMSSEFVVKGGPFGWLMGQFIMRPVMKGVFNKVLSGLAYHCVTGKSIDKDLPEADALKAVVLG